jgi:hypothetical protein
LDDAQVLRCRAVVRRIRQSLDAGAGERGGGKSASKNFD